MIPCLNQGRFLGETINSVLNNGLPSDKIQIGIQDGGSTDQSVAVAQSFRDQLAFIASEFDEGQADAIVKGFNKLPGGPEDIMAWLNADDLYCPGVLAKVLDYFARHPDVDVIYGHRILIDADSQEIGRWFIPPHNRAVLELNDFVPQETLFWRRKLWDKVGGLDVSLKFAMDWDLLLKFLAAGANFRRLPCFIGCFRIHPTQKTSAALHTIGQAEIDVLRTRVNGRSIAPEEMAVDPRLQRFLRRSARIEWLWRIVHRRSLA